jgi:hypothetical protein
MEISYENLLLDAQTGDILLFNSRKYWYSRWIESFLHSKFSHVGIIVRNPSFIDKKLRDGIYILESSYEGIPDSIEQKKIYGVQLIPLEACFHSYLDKTDTGNVYYRQLNCSKKQSFYENFANACKKVYAKSYDLLPQDWLKAEMNIEIGDIQRTDRFWCSALVSYMYVELGLLKKTLPWTLITPNQYSFYENNQLDFQCQLKPEVKVELFK